MIGMAIVPGLLVTAALEDSVTVRIVLGAVALPEHWSFPTQQRAGGVMDLARTLEAIVATTPKVESDSDPSFGYQHQSRIDTLWTSRANSLALQRQRAS